MVQQPKIQSLTVGYPLHIQKAMDEVSHKAMASNHNKCKSKRFVIKLKPDRIIAECFYCRETIDQVMLPITEEQLKEKE